jgi:hypothetical protein
VNRLIWEHIIRASAEIANEDEIVVMGGQAILSGASPTRRKSFWSQVRRTCIPGTDPSDPIYRRIQTRKDYAFASLSAFLSATIFWTRCDGTSS